MSEIHQLFSSLIASGSNPSLRAQLRDELFTLGMWEWPLLQSFVVEHPESDGFRLLAADWFDDVEDHGRAEFIRLQCNLALDLDIGGADADVRSLRAKLGDLLVSLPESLLPDVLPLHEAHVELSDEGVVYVYGAGLTLGYHRGFLSRIELTTPRYFAHAALLFRSHPITAVRLTDKTPVKAIGGSWWWADTCLDPTEPACLARYVPPELYCFLTGSVLSNGSRRQGVNPADLTFPTPESAFSALSSACVNHGRTLAADAAR